MYEGGDEREGRRMRRHVLTLAWLSEPEPGALVLVLVPARPASWGER